MKSEISKKVELEDGITRQKRKLVYVENDTSYTNEEKDEMKKKIEDRMKRMNEDLTVRQESIDILKGKLSNQITSIKETITKVLDKDLTLKRKNKSIISRTRYYCCININSNWYGIRRSHRSYITKWWISTSKTK